MSATVIRIGSRMFLPPHGVARVLGVEERELASSSRSFYVLAIARGQVLLPVDKAAPSGMRELVSVAKAQALLELVATEVETEPAAEGYDEVLKTGRADEYTAVIRALSRRKSSKRLTTNERRLLRVARDYFVSEISAVLERPGSEIEKALP